MDANSIWPNNDYAYFERKGRGEEYRVNAERVRVVRLVSRVEPGNTRESTFVMVHKLNDDGTRKEHTVYNRETYRYEPSDLPVEVKARDIAERWDDYVIERNNREAGNRAREAARQREIDERVAKEQEYLASVSKLLGVEAEHITVTWSTVQIPKRIIDILLAVNKEYDKKDNELVGNGNDNNNHQYEPEPVGAIDEETGEVEEVSDYMNNIINGKW